MSIGPKLWPSKVGKADKKGRSADFQWLSAWEWTPYRKGCRFRRKAIVRIYCTGGQCGRYSCVRPSSNYMMIFIDRQAREIMHLVASVCMSVHPFVCALTLEPFDLRAVKSNKNCAYAVDRLLILKGIQFSLYKQQRKQKRDCDWTTQYRVGRKNNNTKN